MIRSRLSREDQIILEVEDTGPGIPAGEREKVFETFYQVDGSPTRRQGGTGLGLPLSRELARRMGGDITAGAAPGGGALFRFTLPRRRISQPAATPDQSAATLAVPPTTVLRGRVLLAEDNETAAVVVRAMLAHLGVEIVHAADGAAAVELFQQMNPDVVIMDNQMPFLDGIEATRRIRAWEQEKKRNPVPIIGTTADAFEEDRRRCLEAGMTGYLAKPFYKEQLRSLLSNYLSEV